MDQNHLTSGGRSSPREEIGARDRADLTVVDLATLDATDAFGRSNIPADDAGPPANTLDAGDAPGIVPVSANLTRSISQVSRAERHVRNGHKGTVVWFTGLSGSGKSTLATALEREAFSRGWQALVLDGDNIRFGLSADLGFSPHDRSENIRRVAEVAKLFAEADMIAITAFISPYRNDRKRARQIMQQALDIPFVEVYLSTPLHVCEARDPKHLYARARAGEIKEFTGVSAPFETPDQPELVIDTSTVGVEEALALLVEQLVSRIEVR